MGVGYKVEEQVVPQKSSKPPYDLLSPKVWGQDQ